MTTRAHLAWQIVVLLAAMSTILGFSLFMFTRNHEKPKFVEPVIWRELYTGGEAPLQFDI